MVSMWKRTARQYKELYFRRLIKGAVFGGLFGSEVGPEGTVLGAFGGAIEGFFGGSYLGTVTAGACQAAGMYGPAS